MAFVDEQGDGTIRLPTRAAPYTAPAYTAPSPSYAGTAPSPTGVPTYDQIKANLGNSPFYKQAVETAQSAYNLQGDYARKTTGIQNEQDAASQADAARTKQMNDKAIREALGSRGLINSGQTGLELGQSNYNYDKFLRDLSFQKQLREAGQGLSQAQRDQQLGQDSYQALLSAANWYRDLWWDPATGKYVGPGSAQAAPAASVAAAPVAPAQPAAKTASGPYNYIANKQLTGGPVPYHYGGR